MMKAIVLPVSVIVLSLAGLLFSFILAEEFYYAGLPPVDGQQNPAIFATLSNQVCGEANTFFSCETVSKSKYAKFLGYPLALYGIFFYLVTGLSALVLWWTTGRVREIVTKHLFWISTLAVIADLGLLAVTLFVIHALCPFCLLTYLVNALMVVITLLALRRAGSGLFRIARPYRPGLLFYFMAAGLILATGAGAAYGAQQLLMARRISYFDAFKATEIVRSVNHFKEQTEERIIVPPLAVAGPADAPVTIIEMSDFLCPYCAHASTVMDELIAANPDTVRVLFVNLPLDQACNRYMARPMHIGSCQLARGAVCAAGQGKLQAYQQLAFAARKHNPTREDVQELATAAGLSVPAFMQCLESRESLDTVKAHIEATKVVNAKGTPTIFINNKRFEGQLYLESLQQIVDLEVARKRNQ